MIRPCSAGATIAGLLAMALLVSACQKPPPALTTSTIAKGVAAVPEKHPQMTDEGRKDCTICHKEVPDPKQ